MDTDLMKTRQKRRLRRKASTTVNGTVPPRQTLNRDRRPREYLTPKEIERLMERARKRGRYGLRDATMILVAYRHGRTLCTKVGPDRFCPWPIVRADGSARYVLMGARAMSS
jgi:hypothetical protein